MAKSIEKKSICESHIFSQYEDVMLEKILGIIAKFPDVNPSNVSLRVYDYYPARLYMEFCRLETDEEFSKRLEKIEKNKQRRELNKLNKEEKEAAKKKKEEEEAYKLFLSLRERFETKG
jgi:hypothetical protein